jgi:hypothetical protein
VVLQWLLLIVLKMELSQLMKLMISQWHTEKRNVLNDLKNIFGEDIRYIDAIAIMTDTDNSSGRADSYYANLYFSEQ